MRLAITCNGPGETAGWLQPLLREIYLQRPRTQVYVFYVPDDYATGREPAVIREAFAQSVVYDAKTYPRIALGARVDGLPEGADAVLYLGGDLMHAARLHKRLGGAAIAYKFTSRRYARHTTRAFAVDRSNAQKFAKLGVSPDRIDVVGNLAVDGALYGASQPPPDGSPRGGVLFMPGSRPYEVRHLVPFFFTSALAMRREDPALAIAFGISPFTSIDALRDAVTAGGDPRFYARTGRVTEEGGHLYLSSADGRMRFPVVRDALAAATAARLIVTIPGTKVIELAAIGKPVVACTPFNAPELAAINGPLTYLDRIPLLGVPAKRAAVLAYAKRFAYHTQPNIDADAPIVHELRGTLTPGRVARVAFERLADTAWLDASAQALAVLYREHVGAAARMASGILALENTAG